MDSASNSATFEPNLHSLWQRIPSVPSSTWFARLKAHTHGCKSWSEHEEHHRLSLHFNATINSYICSNHVLLLSTVNPQMEGVEEIHRHPAQPLVLHFRGSRIHQGLLQVLSEPAVLLDPECWALRKDISTRQHDRRRVDLDSSEN